MPVILHVVVIENEMYSGRPADEVKKPALLHGFSLHGCIVQKNFINTVFREISELLVKQMSKDWALM
jgi:hypothetical protein